LEHAGEKKAGVYLTGGVTEGKKREKWMLEKKKISRRLPVNIKIPMRLYTASA